MASQKFDKSFSDCGNFFEIGKATFNFEIRANFVRLQRFGFPHSIFVCVCVCVCVHHFLQFLRFICPSQLSSNVIPFTIPMYDLSFVFQELEKAFVRLDQSFFFLVTDSNEIRCDLSVREGSFFFFLSENSIENGLKYSNENCGYTVRILKIIYAKSILK